MLIYCKPIRNITPNKSEPQANDAVEALSESTEPTADPAAVVTDEDDTSKETVSTPGTNGFTLGLWSEQKKAAKKEKVKKIAEERKKETERKNEEKKKIDQHNKNLQFIRKDFMKNQDLDTSVEVEDYVFEDDSSSGSSNAPNPSEGFLDPSLGILTQSFGSISARKIQKEELWKNAVQSQQGNTKKRMLTPESEVRKTKLKKGGKQH